MAKKKQTQQHNSSRTSKNRLRQRKLLLQLFFFIIAVAAVLIITKNMSKEDTTEKPLERKHGVIDFKVQGEVSFMKSNDTFVSKVDVEIADTPKKRETGLMYRASMKEDQGMFFIFDEERLQSFWMRHTVIPLDIIFVNKENVIVKIHHNTQPFLEESYPSNVPAIYVVEVNAGYCKKKMISEGDKIIWRRL